MKVGLAEEEDQVGEMTHSSQSLDLTANQSIPETTIKEEQRRENITVKNDCPLGEKESEDFSRKTVQVAKMMPKPVQCSRGLSRVSVTRVTCEFLN